MRQADRNSPSSRSARKAAAIPHVSRPPPHGITIASGSSRSSRITKAIVPLPAIVWIVERANKGRCSPGKPTLLKRTPPVRNLNFEHTPDESFDRLHLRIGCSIRRDHRAPNAKRARTTRNSLGHLSCRRCHDPAFQIARRQMRDRIRRATNFERPDRLQIFQLEINLRGRGVDVKPDQRRANRRVGDPSARLFDFQKPQHSLHRLHESVVKTSANHVRRRPNMKALSIASVLVLLFVSAVSAQTWDPELQLKVKAVGAPSVSPDGSRVVYTVNEAVMTPEKSEFVSQIWMANIATKQNVQLTFGEKTSTNPKWSPDGKWIAFLSNRKDNRNNLYRLNIDGGEAEPLTELKTN